MPLQPTQNNDELEALAPIEPLTIRGPHAQRPYSFQPEHPMLRYWEVLRKRKWVVLATFSIVFAVSAISTLTEIRLYQATSRVAIFPEVPNVLGFKNTEEVSPDLDVDTTLQTEAAILRSDALALKAIEAMRLYQDPRFTTVKPEPEPAMPGSSLQPDPTKAAGLLGAFKGG